MRIDLPFILPAKLLVERFGARAREYVAARLDEATILNDRAAVAAWRDVLGDIERLLAPATAAYPPSRARPVW